MKIKFFSLATVAALFGFMTSCSNDVNEVPEAPEATAKLEMSLAATPDVRAWSGQQTLYGDMAASRADEETADENQDNAIKYLTDQVEVNLAIEDVHAEDGTVNPKYEGLDLISKLSIHIRSGVDVKVKLPVPREYYCDQDDLYIFNRHEGELFANGGALAQDANVSLTLKVGKIEGNVEDAEHSANGEFSEEDLTEEVTVNINFEDDFILVSTEGITEEIIAWLRENFKDGLNIEVYNYYNRSNMPVLDEEGVVVGGEQTAEYAEYTLTDLKRVLDQSTIEFVPTANTPEYYINAFYGTITTVEVGEETFSEYRDCYVTPVNVDAFNTPYYGPHFNGTDFNLIYENKNLEEAVAGDVTNHDMFGVGAATK